MTATPSTGDLGQAMAQRAYFLLSAPGVTRYAALEATRVLFAGKIADAVAAGREPLALEVAAYRTVKTWLADPDRIATDTSLEAAAGLVDSRTELHYLAAMNA